MSRPTEQEMIDFYWLLRQRELDGSRAELVIGPYTAMIVIGTLQLGMRHPEMTPTQLETLATLIDQLSVPFRDTMGADIIAMGNDTRYDV